MNRLTGMAILFAAVLCCSPSASAGRWLNDWHRLRHPLQYRVDCVGGFCCDDYCRKRLPFILRLNWFGPDDYRAKCLPPATPVSRFECDDYCRKLLPSLNCPPLGQCP